MTFVDPKTGKLLWKADVQQFDAQSIGTGTVLGVMRGVYGILYSNGHPVDSLQAPSVTANNGSKIVTALGGVRIISLTQAATSLTCDKVVWYTAQNKMVGTGNVIFKTGGFTQSSSSFRADTKLMNVMMPAPGLSASAPVHVTFQH